MESLGKLQFHHQPLLLSVNHRRPSFPRPLSSLSFRTLPRSSPPSSPFFKLPSFRASSSSSPSSSDPCYQNHQNSKLSSLQSHSSYLLKTTCVAVTAAAALFFMNLQLKPAIAVPVSTSSSVMAESAKEANEDVSFEELERTLEQHLASKPEDIEALRSLMEVRIKSRKLQKAIEVIDKLIELEPDEKEWPLLKAQIFSYSGDLESAKNAFEEILAKDPLRVEAYHGLVMTYSESGLELKDLEKRVKEAMQKCTKERKKKDFRDFKLLVAQIRVVEGKHNEALRVYQELAKEEPRDFRPYLCQGIIYTLLKKKDEAEKQFEKFRKLVPRNHPYREYFVDNMVATKLFAEKAEREMADSRS